MSLDLHSHSEAESRQVGKRLAALLFPSAVVGLIGQLGAGKTLLIRSIAVALGVPDERVVTSPTFVLIQEYQGQIPIYHFDAYRLRSQAEFLELGAHEYFEGDGVCLVEWADRVEACMPPERLRVRIEVTGPESRRFVIEGVGARYEELVRKLETIS